MGSLWKQANEAQSVCDLLQARLAASIVRAGDSHQIPVVSSTASEFTHGEQFSQFTPLSLDATHIAFASQTAAAAAGFLGGTGFNVGPARVDIPKFGDNFCAVTLTPLAREATYLITIVGKVENTQA